MKTNSVSKWIALGSLLAFAYACNCQKKEESSQPRKEAPSKEENGDDREDGDMCALPSEDQREEQQLSAPKETAKPVAEKSTVLQEKPAPELKAESPVLSEAPAPAKSEVPEAQSTVEAPAPEKAAAVGESSATL